MSDSSWTETSEAEPSIPERATPEDANDQPAIAEATASETGSRAAADSAGGQATMGETLGSDGADSPIARGATVREPRAEAPLPPLAGVPAWLGREQDPPRALAQQNRGGVVVYAGVAGAAAVIPVPFVDAFLGKLARGSAMRRVAQRRGVRLTPEARDVLARPGLASRLGTAPARLLRNALTQALAPLRIASRIEDAAATFLSALLLDHYLLTADRRPASPMSEHEAKVIRDAMEASWAEMGLETLRSFPLGFSEIVGRALRAAVQPDSEGRGPIERLADALLDGAADAPEDFLQRMREQFDGAVAARRGELNP